MDLDVFSRFCSEADRNGVLFYYHGEVSPNVVAAMSDTVRQRLENVEASALARRKVFSAFMEMAQNILHYGAKGEGWNAKMGALAVEYTGEHFYVLCSNAIEAEHVERIKSKIDPVCQMSLDEVKAAYRAQLRNDEHEKDPISKGAGLGFLTLAREASQPIEYQIHLRNHDAQHADFFLRAAI
jgi:hypothetical protein